MINSLSQELINRIFAEYPNLKELNLSHNGKHLLTLHEIFIVLTRDYFRLQRSRLSRTLRSLRERWKSWTCLETRCTAWGPCQSAPTPSSTQGSLPSSTWSTSTSPTT